jgi:thiol:disulfide interchange protein DsbD
MVIIAFAAWLYEFSKYANTIARFSGISIASLSLGLALVGGYLGIATTPANATLLTTVDSVKHFEPYSAARLAALRADGKPVFINFTAAWCISCLVNEKVALSQSSVIDTFKQAGITYLKGDWTNSDAEITKILAEFGRSGVPLYVFYPAGSNTQPIILPQILTPEIVTRTVTGEVVSAAL